MRLCRHGWPNPCANPEWGGALEMTLSEQVAHAVPADLSTLAWVADELRRTLDNAHKALRMQVRDTEAAPQGTEIDGAASAAMQQARALFHQSAGALDMVGQVEGARML